MTFLDELTIHAKAGDGGNGVVRWRREKYEPKGGPAGGNGGRGGDVYIEAVRDISQLWKMSHKKDYKAERGEDGRGQNQQGKDGEDLILKLPVGSVVTNKETGQVWQLLTEGQREKILTGGNGGFGNEHYKSSSNTTPERANPGLPGEEGTFYIELQLVVDAGFIGLPNAGKSSLLNALTNAQAKVGDYQFTTLDPNLGELYGFILADIPGLIEGASEGKGLGHKFLRHIKRTKLIFHLISLERDSVLKDYHTVRKELDAYENLSQKPEVIILTKTDTVDAATIQKIREELAPFEREVLQVSVINAEEIKNLQDRMIKILRSLDA